MHRKYSIQTALKIKIEENNVQTKQNTYLLCEIVYSLNNLHTKSMIITNALTLTLPVERESVTHFFLNIIPCVCRSVKVF